MRYTQETAKLLHKQELAPGVFNLILSAPAIAGAAAAGQFVNVLCDAYALRRPISICGFDAQSGILRLVFEVRGKGTAWLAQLENGAPVDLIGPLGHGFPLLEPDKRAVLIGGGEVVQAECGFAMLAYCESAGWDRGYCYSYIVFQCCLSADASVSPFL